MRPWVCARTAAARPGGRYDAATLGSALQRLDDLQRQLDRTTARLDEKAAQLAAKEQECRALEDRLQDSVDFALTFLTEDAGALSSDPTADNSPPSAENLAALQSELRSTRELRDQHARQLQELRLELLQADLELADLRDRAEREIAAVIEERLVLEAAAGNALLQTGDAAAAPLVTLLGHDRAEVRMWAAAVLGEMGSSAQSAVEPLTMLLSDDDPRVADEARRALAAIGP